MRRLQDLGAPDKSGCVISASVQLPTGGFTVVASPPAFISQKTSEALAGLPSRVFLEIIREPGFPLPVVRLRKLRLVAYGGFIAWVASSPEREAAASVLPRAANDAAPVVDSGFEGLVNELGLERTRPGLKSARAKGRS
jgi:hypothetical protein